MARLSLRRARQPRGAFFSLRWALGVARRAFPALFTLLVGAAMQSTHLPGAPPTVAAPAQGVPEALVVVSAPDKVLIGEEFTFSVTFSNPGPGTGWGPFVDVVLDAGGADLDAPAPSGPPPLPCDGVSYVDAVALPSAGPTEVHVGPAPCGPGSPPGTSAPHALGLPDVSTVPGGQLVTALFPVGSYTPGEPDLTMEVTARVHGFADRQVPLRIWARGGYKFGVGSSPTPQPSPVVSHPDPNSETWEGTAVLPDVMCVSKTYLGPQDEAVSGPNFVDYYPLRYRIEVDVADGQTIQGLEIRDQLPSGLVYTDDVTIEPASGVMVTPTTHPVPGAIVIARWPTITGTAGGPEAVLEFDFYVPAHHVNDGIWPPPPPVPVVDLETCDPTVLVNDMWAQGHWWPEDPRDVGDEPELVKVDVSKEDHKLAAKCLAIQKSAELWQNGRPGPDGYTPGDVIQYTLRFQISDYATFGNMVITDTLGNGHSFLPSETATLQVTDRFGTTSKEFTPGQDLTVTEDRELDDFECKGIPGGTQLVFDLSAALARSDNPGPTTIPRHANGVLTGGHAFAPTSPVPATGEIRYYARIDDAYDALDSQGLPADSDPIDKHDPLVNCVVMSGWRHTNAKLDIDLMALPISAGDGCEIEVRIIPPTTEKEIVGVNGAPLLSGTTPTLAPGDEVTFKIDHWVPTGGAENLVITDWLPQPVTSVAGMPPLGSAALPDCVAAAGGGAAWPAVNGACLWPAATLSNAPHQPPFAPTWGADSGDNRVEFRLGTFHDPQNVPVDVEIYVTVQLTTDAYPDGLHLANLASVCETDSWGKPYCNVVIKELKLGQPVLRVRKGVVGVLDNNAATFDPGAPNTDGKEPYLPPGVSFPAPGTAGCAPPFGGVITSSGLATGVLDDDMFGADAGDVVRFAVVVENTGSSPKGAFEVTLRDELPPGLTSPANLCVADGTGAPLTFTPLGSGYFDQGILIHDPNFVGDAGGLDRFSPTSGRNLAVITFDAELALDVPVGQCQTNWAYTDGYAGHPGGENHVGQGLGGPHEDPARVCTPPRPTKTVVATSEVHTPPGDPVPVTIGEIVRYRLRVAIPEGQTTALELVDKLDPGLMVLDAGAGANATGVLFTSDGNLTVAADLAGALAGEPEPPVSTRVGPAPDGGLGIAVPPARIAVSGTPATGQTLTLALGDITNSDNDPDIEAVNVEFNALVLNSWAAPGTGPAANVAGDKRVNQLTVRVGGEDVGTAVSAEAVVVEPRLTITKTIASDVDPFNWSNLPASYELTVTNQDLGDGLSSDAFEVVITDTLGVCLGDVVSASAERVNPDGSPGGTAGVVVTVGPGPRELTVTVDRLRVGEGVRISYDSRLACPDCDGLENDARVTWTSLPGPNGTAPGPPGTGSPPAYNPTGSAVPGASGAWNGERTGSGTAANSYAAEESVSLCGTVCGTKFEDTDGDGQWDQPAEASLAGWEIRFTAGGTQVASLVTPHKGMPATEPGAWCIQLLPALYDVAEVLTPQMQAVGWHQTEPAGGAPHQVNVGIDDTITGVDFGNVQCPEVVSGVKYLDANGNGKRDPGEVGLGGWTIQALLPGTPPTLVTTTTAPDGSFSFHLSPGNWQITEQLKAGWVRTHPTWPESVDNTGAVEYPAGGYGVLYECTALSEVKPEQTPPIEPHQLDFGNRPVNVTCPPGKRANRIVAWGDDPNEFGAIGGIPATSSPVVVAGSYIAVGAGYKHTIAVNAAGEIEAWGTGKAVIDKPAGGGFVAAAAAADNSLALHASGALHGWGDNVDGLLPGCAAGTSPCVDSGPYVAADMGYRTTAAIDGNRNLVAWGSNHSNRMPGGCAYSVSTCSYDDAQDFVAVAIGRNATYAVDDIGRLHAWGASDLMPTAVLGGTCVPNGAPQPGFQSGQYCVAQPSGSPFVEVAAGDSHGLARDATGSLYAWGVELDTEISDTPAATGFRAVVGGVFSSLAIASDNTLRGWGTFAAKHPPITPPGGTYAAIDASGGEWAPPPNFPSHTFRGHHVAIECVETVGPPTKGWTIYLSVVLKRSGFEAMAATLR